MHNLFQVVPTNITTAHGGFYINTGNLEFKARESADDDSDLEAVYQASFNSPFGFSTFLFSLIIA